MLDSIFELNSSPSTTKSLQRNPLMKDLFYNGEKAELNLKVFTSLKHLVNRHYNTLLALQESAQKDQTMDTSKQ